MKTTRREFMGLGMSAAVGAMVGPAAFAARPEEIRAVLLHLGMNMWGDWRASYEPVSEGVRYTRDAIFFSESCWNRTVDHAKARGLNMILMDLGEFVEYPSHPELSVKGSWKADRMNAEVRRLKAMGLEPIPKLNFSSRHDSWLKEYHRMLATRTYYNVCSDLIKDVCDIFDHPRFFHIGFDEEDANNGRLPYVAARQGELWWHSLRWFSGQVERLGMRPWMFSDYGWFHPGYVEKCPKSILQSNWYYNEDMQGYVIDQMTQRYQPKLRLFAELDKAGFDQVPCPSNWVSDKQKQAGKTDNSDCAGEVVRHCRTVIAPERLKGFLMASWADCEGEAACRFNCAGIDQLAAALD